MYVCTIKIQVPRAHEVKHQRVIAKRTSQTMENGQDVIIQKWTDVYYPIWEVVLGAPDRVNINIFERVCVYNYHISIVNNCTFVIA